MEDNASFRSLPQEIVEIILSFCDKKTLLSSICVVSKQLANATSENNQLWKRRCELENKDLSSKTLDKSWKHFYIYDIRLFPLYGLTLGKSTQAEVRKSSHITSFDTFISCATVDNTYLMWFRISKAGAHLFSSITGLKRVDPLPRPWEDQGISWKKSFNQYKRLFTNWTQNYRINTDPELIDTALQLQSTIQLITIVKEAPELIYSMTLFFAYSPTDTDDSPNTLFSMRISTFSNLTSLEDEFKRYHISNH